MGNLRPVHWFEAVAWLLVALFFYFFSFEFDREIEIYRFGASAWPRAILLLIVIAAIGQLISHYRRAEGAAGSTLEAASDDGAETAREQSGHNQPSWYLHTFALLVLPFVYMIVPDWLAASGENSDLHPIKLATAAAIAVVFIALSWRNHVGAVLTAPILFAAWLQDLGFYALAPVFVVTITFYMGERKITHLLAVMIVIITILLLLFVKLLFVGLPTGYIPPFYDFGNWVVALLS